MTMRLWFTAIMAAWLTVTVAACAKAQSRSAYLQKGTPNSMTVVWKTLAVTDSIVCYGTAPDALTQRADGSPGTQHEVEIGGLAPSTRYYYSAGETPCPRDGDSEDFFLTAPTVGSDYPFRMWVLGDSGTGNRTQAAVRDAMLRHTQVHPPELLLHMGDMAYDDGLTEEFDDHFFAPYESILRHTVTWPTIGNHEGRSADSGAQTGPYYDAYVLPRLGEAGGLPSGTEAYYAFDYGQVHFVVLDSHGSPRGMGDAMLQWLQMDLAATDQPWTVAYFHHPPYTKGSHDSDVEQTHIDMRTFATPILEAAGVDLVLGGHSHAYERSFLVEGAYDTPTFAEGHIVNGGDGRPDGDGPYSATGPGAVYVVAGHGGAGTSGDVDHPLMAVGELYNGSCLVDVSADELRLTNLRHTGEVSDVVSLVRNERALVWITPAAGQRLARDEAIMLRWRAVGTTASPFELSYATSADGPWTPIASVSTDAYLWTAPDDLLETFFVRVRDAGSGVSSTVGPLRLGSAGTELVLPFGSQWAFYDQATPPPDDWATALGSWPEGLAQLGYGDGDEVTTLVDADPNVPSAYFRRVLTLDALPVAGTLNVLFDDGAAVFINGEQVFAHNMADGLAHDAWASAQSDDNEVQAQSLDFEGAQPFRVGQNVIAAVVKQVNEVSSDLSFDLSLELTFATPEPPPVIGPGDAGVDRGDGGAEPAISGSGSCSVAAGGDVPRWPGAGLFVLAWVRFRRRRRRSSRYA